MKFAVLGLFGLLAVAAAYPYPEHPRYRPVPKPRYPERFSNPEATHDDNHEFKGLVRALVQTMDHPEANHETPYSQPERMNVPVHSKEYNDLISALSQEELPAPAMRPIPPRSRAQEKLDHLNVRLQSHERELLNRVEEEMAKYPDVRPGTPEYDALLEKIHGMFNHPGGDKCPDGSQEVNCLSSPCNMASCPAHPEASCKEDYCGGCNYYFVDGDGKYDATDCYTMEDAGQKAYTAAKEVLAQHGKMEYDELLQRLHKKLDLPRIQTDHKQPAASYNPVFPQQFPAEPQSKPYQPYQPRYGDVGRRPAMPHYGNVEMAPRYGDMERGHYPNRYNPPRPF